MFVIAKLLDLGTTFVAITAKFGYEGNPFSAYLLNSGGWLLLSVVGLSVTVAQALVLTWYQGYLARKNVPNFVLAICRGGIVLCVCIILVAVVNNFMVILLAVA